MIRRFDGEVGTRLDAGAAQLFPDYSRARLRVWIEQGLLELNGEVVKRPRQPLSPNDQLRLVVPEELDSGEQLRAQNIPLDVVYEDADLAVINKPAGLTVHPGAGQRDGTMVNALLHRYPSAGAIPRAGLIHRLDKDTSGLLVVAVSVRAHTHLVKMMAARNIKREYDAVVHGDVTGPGHIDAPIGRDRRHRTRMAVTHGGRDSVTHYRVIERFSRATWLRVQLETGRTHQIRVHMAHSHRPLIGDAAYGGRRRHGPTAGFLRQALHARFLTFVHPLSGIELALEAPMPSDLNRLIDQLRAASG